MMMEDSLMAFICPMPSRALDDEFENYLSALTSYSIERLAQEPSFLDIEGKEIKKKMENLAFQHYKTFISTTDCVQSVQQKIESINNHLGGLLESLPTLINSCSSFSSKAQKINLLRQKNQLTLSRTLR
eukprot:TRINITY_DN8178_c0_g1_i1.p1 TRINITY_DN8178_c0_g1~~TRINITY_DN8178_c0_g1_i1.p1  ORF type:complete len:144 (-),score=45.81 TRINITY_DN8178_c0_g1_i1:4-390(-)